MAQRFAQSRKYAMAASLKRKMSAGKVPSAAVQRFVSNFWRYQVWGWSIKWFKKRESSRVERSSLLCCAAPAAQ